MTWDAFFINMLPAFAARSKDPHTQLGCAIVGPSHNLLSMGYNSFPRGINDNVPERLERPEKYHWMEHAERNAIYNAAREGIRIADATLYVPIMPCMDCARAIVNVGITTVIVDKRRHMEYVEGRVTRWDEDFRRVYALFGEAGVDLHFWEPAL